MKFRKKAMVEEIKTDVEVEAVQITAEFFDGGHPNPLHPIDRRIVYNPVQRTVEIETLEGIMTAKEGDWIITGVKGDLYPCKPDIFEATYKPVWEKILPWWC
jgi:hypothetical protein